MISTATVLAVVVDTPSEGLVDAVDDVAVGLAEAGHRSGLRADEADLEGRVLRGGAGDAQDGRGGNQGTGRS